MKEWHRVAVTWCESSAPELTRYIHNLVFQPWILNMVHHIAKLCTHDNVCVSLASVSVYYVVFQWGQRQLLQHDAVCCCWAPDRSSGQPAPCSHR